jgi:hypothetical protein
MRDWNALVRDRLLPLDLPPHAAQEVITELAAHLEDLYEEHIGEGLSKPEAEEKALNEVIRWRPLAQDIHRAKDKEEIMNPRAKQLWLPSLVSLTTAALSPMAFPLFGLQPRLYYAHHAETTVYFPWLAVLPLCGAAGAYLSRRAGGERSARLTSSLFPAIAVLTCLGLILVTSIVVEKNRLGMWTTFALLVFNWVLLPGAALLLGALPFMRPPTQRGADAVQRAL